ncbi:MAG TPA: SLATT domain-containing protein [Acetobacteraceae bacterium]
MTPAGRIPVNIAVPPFDPDAWADKPLEQAIPDLFVVADAHAQSALHWYARAKQRKSLASRSVRCAAIVAGVLGGLAPIVAGSGILPGSANELAITQAGYLLIGLAAGLLALDHFLGLSSGWMRYIVTMMTIERLRADFAIDWGRMRRAQASAPDIVSFLDRALAFRTAVMDAIEGETNSWVVEFRTSISDLEAALQRRRAAADARMKELPLGDIAAAREHTVRHHRAGPKPSPPASSESPPSSE